MYKFIFVCLVVSVLCSSCKDEELDQLMEEYCACIDKYKMDSEGRLECIEFMEELQQKYKGKPRKLNALVEKAGSCF